MRSEPLATSLAPTVRAADLDWLRVVAILLLHLFHVGMMFNPWDWHLKAPVTMDWLRFPMSVLHLVRMPLLMLVSGAGTALALRRRTLGAFAWDRTKRLLLPLAVGIFVVVPPQIYFERRNDGVIAPGYGAFYRSVFDFVPYPAGSFSWHHLWFVAYLFVYCLAALPLFAWLARPSGMRAVAWLETRLVRGPWTWLLFLPLAGVNLLFAGYPDTHALLNDPKVVSYYALLFVYGHLLARMPRLWERITARRRVSLWLVLPLWAALLPDGRFPGPLEQLACDAASWWSLLAVLGYARSFVTTRSPWVAYAQGIAYPFYILHQTVIVAVGYALLHGVGAIPSQASLAPEWQMLEVLLVSFALTWAGCALIARLVPLRPLFGMPLHDRNGSRARTDTPPTVLAVS